MSRAPAALALLACLWCAGCGQAATAPPPSWLASHSGTAVVAFETAAPGVCQLTVRYPDEAPAAIAYGGAVFVQVAKSGAASPPPGATPVLTSGDWTVVRTTTTTLALYTRDARYDYRAEATC